MITTYKDDERCRILLNQKYLGPGVYINGSRCVYKIESSTVYTVQYVAQSIRIIYCCDTSPIMSTLKCDNLFRTSRIILDRSGVCTVLTLPRKLLEIRFRQFFSVFIGWVVFDLMNEFWLDGKISSMKVFISLFFFTTHSRKHTKTNTLYFCVNITICCTVTSSICTDFNSLKRSLNDTQELGTRKKKRHRSHTEQYDTAIVFAVCIE